jgi:hypothetical protein
MERGRKEAWRLLVLSGALIGAASLCGFGQDTDAATTAAFTVTFNETVRITITSEPGTPIPFPGALGEEALETRYFDLTSFEATVYAITDYQVTGQIASVTGAGAAAAGVVGGSLDDLLEIQHTSFSNVPDDGGDDPVSDLTGWEDLRLTDISLWHGGNTEGGSATGQADTLELRLDLDEVGDQAVANTLVITLTLTVTEN